MYNEKTAPFDRSGLLALFRDSEIRLAAVKDPKELQEIMQQLLKEANSMARTFTPEEIAEMKALRAHPPDPAYDEEDELFDGKLPPEEFKARCSTQAFTPGLRADRASRSLRPAQPLQMVLAEISLCEQSMRHSEEMRARWHADDDIVHKLDEVSGIGLLTASALKTAVGKPERFASGRHQFDNTI